MNYLKIVSKLNAELYDLHKEETKCFNYTTNDFVDVILFEDNIIWCSEYDEREWDSKKGIYKVSLITHIRSEYNKWVDSLVRLKFKTPRKR